MTIGGLSGLIIDVSMKPEATLACGSMGNGNPRIWVIANVVGWVYRDTKARFILLDRGDRQSMIVNIDSRGLGGWNEIFNAMSIVDTFKFARTL